MNVKGYQTRGQDPLESLTPLILFNKSLGLAIDQLAWETMHNGFLYLAPVKLGAHIIPYSIMRSDGGTLLSDTHSLQLACNITLICT